MTEVSQTGTESFENIWCPQPGPQLMATTCPADIIVFGGARGGGKMMSNSSKILTSKGWITHGEVRIGDTVIDPVTGGSQEVVNVFPQGELDIYKVQFDDGAVVYAGLEHLWAYKCANRKRPGTKKSKQREFLRSLGYEYPDNRFEYLKVHTTEKLIEELNGSGGHAPRIPLTNPVLFDVNGRTGTNDIPPYLIGLMLGDGTFSKGRSGNRITTGDSEVAEYLAELGFTQNESRETSWYLPIDNPLNTQLNNWAGSHGLLGKTGEDKFIPSYIFTANIQYRLQVLQGLLDSDGYVDNRGHIEFVSVSDHLIYGVQDLVRSFGGKATVSEPITGSYKDEYGNRIECKQYRRIYIRINMASSFFGLSRKKERCTDNWNGGHENMRKVISIEYSHREEATCIKVSSPHGLYITDDYVVTHNSDCAIGRQIIGAMQHGYAWNGLFLRKNYKHFNDLRRRIDELIRHGLPATRVGGDQQTNTIKFDNGARILLTAIEREEQLEFFQGQSLCVGEGTRILMSDGNPKNIEDIEPGDFVQTLEGPREVTRKMPPRLDYCVEARNESGFQIHPSSHPVFSAFGWQSFASIQGSDSRATDSCSQGSSQPQSVDIDAVCVPHYPDQSAFFENASRESYIWQGLDLGQPQKMENFACLQRLFFSFLDLEQQLLSLFCMLLHSQSLHAWSCGDSCGRQLSKVQYFLYCYWFYSHLGDVLFHLYQELFQDTPLGSDGADEIFLYLRDLLLGDSGNIQGHSQTGLSRYSHLYDGTVRPVAVQNKLSALRFTPVGYRVVHDLTVRSANHYISYDTGLVNGNTEISIEEATQFPFIDQMIDKLSASLRSPHGVQPHMFVTCNPGGPGHGVIRSRFVAPEPRGGKVLKDGEDRAAIFIPSNVEDNKVLCQNDPGYVNALKSIKDPKLRRAWLEGDWDVVLGGFFDDVWDEYKHVLRQFRIPKHWPRLMGLDWGTARPFSVGWFAISGGDVIPELGYALPKGSIIHYAEWYGCTKDNINEGLRLNSSQVAEGIKMKEQQRGEGQLIFDRIADPAIFKEDDGPTIAEKFADHDVVLRRGDNRRIYGWDEMRKMLAGKEYDTGDLHPLFYVTENCINFRQTIPTLERDDNNWEDVDTDGVDHIADMPLHPDTLVHTEKGYSPIKDLPKEGLVYTINGELTKYHSCRLTQKNAPLVEVEFTDGQKERCTPEHEFPTTQGFIPAKDLTGHSVLANVSQKEEVQLCNHVKTELSAKLIDVRNFWAKNILNAARIFRVPLCNQDFIGMFGNISQVKRYLTDMISTMKISIQHTMNMRTLCLSNAPSTTSCTPGSECLNSPMQTWLPSCRKPEKLQQSGISQKKEDSGIGNNIKNTVKKHFTEHITKTANNVVPSLKEMYGENSAMINVSPNIGETKGLTMKNVNASAAELPSLSTNMPGEEPAQSNVQQPLALKSVKAVRNVSERADVYCMTVPKTEIFEIRGGVLTHNCRYVLMSRPGSGMSINEVMNEENRMKGYFERDWDEIVQEPIGDEEFGALEINDQSSKYLQ